jgi:hypothetical protein
MALKTYPETAQETADRINRATTRAASDISSSATAAANDATAAATVAVNDARAAATAAAKKAVDAAGVSARQAINSLGLNEKLTAMFGIGGSGKPSSGPGSTPYNASVLTAGLSDVANQATNEGQAALDSFSSEISKIKLDQKASELSAGFTSGLNQLAGDQKNFGNSAMGKNVTVNSAVSGAVDTLRSVAGSTSNIAADITGSLNKLTGGDLAGGFMKVAGKFGAAAGMVNNLLSQKRGANLPAGAQPSATQGEVIKLNAGSNDDWRVRIDCEWDNFNSLLFKQLQDTGGVIFPYLPNITVSTKAEYSPISITHGNYAQYSYKNSTVDDITISGEFSCETADEGVYWIAATTFFKTATKMFFGQGALAGNPPIICKLYGYGSRIFDNVPVIIKSFSVDFKDDVNYIRCDTGYKYTWVPTLSTITVVVAPIYTRQGLRTFNIQDYARGNMIGQSGVGYI